MIKQLLILCSLTTFFTPYQDAESQYLAFLDKAESKVRVAIYGFTDPRICDELIKLKNKGVDVQIVMDKTQAAGTTQRTLVAKLQAAKIPLKIGKSKFNQIMHCKFTTVDDKMVEDGSWNYSPTASKQDNFLNFSDDPARVKMFNQFWNQIRMDMK